eukprot:CAMPEP_0184345458 /NCGR_PEP_ID=MMETSP1089-20130417/13871_1 /TAXON_ID=38269 ORGANISM="Gloeochaete wittrockiana, Strain SAG46.84" /NCGR_SAMPLE_ID=MMETSP1089 /ASSEMBLY_ACC=CAM_ASM_000445 /LENGTH=88 /DNA_ID=CAMNT_0026675771 /DNA_START=10 /DNA_END=276 /DNA_ORIENTATION=-
MPVEMKALVNTYVRNEFRLHKKATPAQAQSFMREWSIYLEKVSGAPPDTIVGEDMDEKVVNRLSPEQKIQLQELKKNSFKFYDIPEGN